MQEVKVCQEVLRLLRRRHQLLRDLQVSCPLCCHRTLLSAEVVLVCVTIVCVHCCPQPCQQRRRHGCCWSQACMRTRGSRASNASLAQGYATMLPMPASQRLCNGTCQSTCLQLPQASCKHHGGQCYGATYTDIAVALCAGREPHPKSAPAAATVTAGTWLCSSANLHITTAETHPAVAATCCRSGASTARTGQAARGAREQPRLLPLLLRQLHPA